MARAVFCTAVGLRAVLVWLDQGAEGGRAELTLPALLLAVGFSTYVFLAYRHRSVPGRVLLASVALDAVVCFLALVPNGLWPLPGFDGFVNFPDTAAILIITFAAGFRLSVPAALTGLALNGLSFAALVSVDLVRAPVETFAEPHHLSLYLILLCGAGLLAWLVAAGTRDLVERGAREAVRAERARVRLEGLLGEHHDLRSLLSSATLNADLVLRLLADGGGGEGSRTRRLAEELRTDLGQVNAFVHKVRAQAEEEIAALAERSGVEVDSVLASVCERLGRWFGEVRIEVVGATGRRVAVAGGERSLQRILQNLLVNACEGDGRTHAGRVQVTVSHGEDGVTLEVNDDGPGFPPVVPRGSPGGFTSKPDGSGYGLYLVSTLVGASDGSLIIEDVPKGGARVRVTLPSAEEPGSPGPVA